MAHVALVTPSAARSLRSPSCRLRTNGLRIGVVAAAVAFAASACGSSRHVAFSSFSGVGRLSVPVPPGFHVRFWRVGAVRAGIAISDGPIGPGGRTAPLTAGYLPMNPTRVALDVYRLDHMTPAALARHILLPLTLAQLSPATKQTDGVLRGGAFVLRGHDYGVQVWLGRSAPAADRSTVLGALAAIETR